MTFFAFSVLILGGLGSYRGVAVGAVLFWFVLEGTRFIDLPDPPFTETPHRGCSIRRSPACC